MRELKTVGQSVLQNDTRDKVTGETLYASAVDIPGILHIIQVFAERPLARILTMDIG